MTRIGTGEERYRLAPRRNARASGVFFLRMGVERVGRVLRTAAAGLATVLAGVLLSGADGRSPRHHVPEPRHFRGVGILPLDGEMGPLGLAFRDGFLEGLASRTDSLFDWKWDWQDDGGDPSSTRALLGQRNVSRSDLVLVGLSTAASGLGPCPVECLVLDDGGARAPDSLRHDLWPSATVARDRWIRRLRSAPGPRAMVVHASGAWTEPVFPVLADSVPGLSYLLHDPETVRWDDVVQRLLEIQPASIGLWNTPSEASSLLSRRLLWPLLRRARLWVPYGTVLPPGVVADTLRPVWQAVPGAPVDDWRGWGRRCGQALASATRIRILDTLPRWIPALSRVPSDSTMESTPAGWYPPGP